MALFPDPMRHRALPASLHDGKSFLVSTHDPSPALGPAWGLSLYPLHSCHSGCCPLLPVHRVCLLHQEDRRVQGDPAGGKWGREEEGIRIPKRTEGNPHPSSNPPDSLRPHLESWGASGALFTSLTSGTLSGDSAVVMGRPRRGRAGGSPLSCSTVPSPQAPVSGILTEGPGGP